MLLKNRKDVWLVHFGSSSTPWHGRGERGEEGEEGQEGYGRRGGKGEKEVEFKARHNVVTSASWCTHRPGRRGKAGGGTQAGRVGRRLGGARERKGGYCWSETRSQQAGARRENDRAWQWRWTGSTQARQQPGRPSRCAATFQAPLASRGMGGWIPRPPV